MRTQGCIRLKAYLAEEGGRTQVWLAGELGVSGPAVNQWLRGTQRPTHPRRVLIERLTGIPADAWFSTREQKEQEAQTARLGAAAERVAS